MPSVSFLPSSSIDCLIAWWVSGPGERYRAAEMEVDGERQGCWQGYDVGSQSRFHATEEPVTGGQRRIGSFRGAADVLWAPVWLEDAAGNSPARGCRTAGRLPFISISFILRDTCLSYVRLSQAGIVSKRLNELACFFGMRGSFLWPVLNCTSKNKGTSLWNFAPNSGLRKFRYDRLIVKTCYQPGSRKVDAQSVINWTVVGQLSWQYLQAPTLDHCSLSQRSSSSV